MVLYLSFATLTAHISPSNEVKYSPAQMHQGGPGQTMQIFIRLAD